MRFVPDIHKALWGEERWLLSSHPSAPSHIVPWSKGGKTTAENCKMLCRDCTFANGWK